MMNSHRWKKEELGVIVNFVESFTESTLMIFFILAIILSTGENYF